MLSLALTSTFFLSQAKPLSVTQREETLVRDRGLRVDLCLLNKRERGLEMAWSQRQPKMYFSSLIIVSWIPAKQKFISIVCDCFLLQCFGNFYLKAKGTMGGGGVEEELGPLYYLILSAPTKKAIIVQI